MFYPIIFRADIGPNSDLTGHSFDTNFFKIIFRAKSACRFAIAKKHHTRQNAANPEDRSTFHSFLCVKMRNVLCAKQKMAIFVLSIEHYKYDK